MPSTEIIPLLLGLAVLAPLLSFALIVIFGPRMGSSGYFAGYVSIGAIVLACALSFVSFAVWIGNHFPASSHHGGHAEAQETAEDGSAEGHGHHAKHPHHHDDEGHVLDEDHGHDAAVPIVSGTWYTLGRFAGLELTIGYYVDTLTVCMFCMVTLISSCIHFYSVGYMHDELHDFEDPEVTLNDGSQLKRPGRFHRFFQYMSLFCFSMLGLVVSGNVAMTFVFWELVGICSYFLIGFYVERHSASTAANKAFIVNRVGDFGMIIGMMALWSSLGTFNFGDVPIYGEDGQVVVGEHGETETRPGIFSLVRPANRDHQLTVPDGMVQESARAEVGVIVDEHLNHPLGLAAAESEISARIDEWRQAGYGRWLLIIAGVGIFCGCVGKSAQFPLHTWLPDAMEGPTPVSALVHSATMVAAGVFLVGRFYPVFVPEVLLVIAVVGCITLFMAATIAITATDIKRVLAYSTVSQLGYMMLALGAGGWLAGMFHLFTHAFFKSLLFLGSGSVIHAVHTNEMTEMGGLRKKMPWTAYTMLIGCLAIAGAGIPFMIGLSGYYSKDAILEQVYSFWIFEPANRALGTFLFAAAAGGAAITAFYMFRLWYMTFAGPPRDKHRYDHAHESPPVMYVPLVILAIFAVGVAWEPFAMKPFPESWAGMSLKGLLEQARPIGTAVHAPGELVSMVWPNEHYAHQDNNFYKIRWPATMTAFLTALSGFVLATMFYGLRYVDPADVGRQFRTIYRFLLNKWWFDELYDLIWVRPVMFLSRLVAGFDRRWIDGFIDALARFVAWIARWGDRWLDRGAIDGLANLLAQWTYSFGRSLRRVQTGRLREYVLFIVAGTVGAFILIAFFFWSYSAAG